MEENKKPVVGLNDQERFPLINDLSFLNKLRQDEYAPSFNFQSGDRLGKVHLDKVLRYAQMIRGSQAFCKDRDQPDWVEEYFEWCRKTVPLYLNRKGKFTDQPTIAREDLSTKPWDFVSAEADLNDLLVYQTSGTSGAAMDVIFDPVSQACWIPQLQSVLDRFNITIDNGPETVAIALICSQSATLTYASLSTFLNGAGVLKINLHPDEWRSPQHRIWYLEKFNPQILTGDPFAFHHLLELKPNIRPQVMVSSAMKLSEGLRKKLEGHFLCPVIDIYSLTECRMVAVAENNKHRAIRPDLYLEVFDKDNDVRVKPGERGELVISGGNNPFLPLVRYRTGDFCSIEMKDGIPYLIDLEARKPVPLYNNEGILINNIEVSRMMTKYPLSGFNLHQSADLRLTFTGWSNQDLKSSIEQSLKDIFGEGISLEVTIFKNHDLNRKHKTVCYSSDIKKTSLLD